MNALTQSSLFSEALDWLYDRVAGDLSDETGSERDIDRWIRLACTQAGAAGFVTNLGGVLTLPIAIPANLAGTAAVQMRLIAKIAAARGYDTHSEEVRTFVFACLLGNAATDVLKDTGLRLGLRAGQKLAGPALARINQTVLSRLLARFGAQGAVSFTKIIPFVSGLVGAGLDAAGTRIVGSVAKRVFVARNTVPVIALPDESPPVALLAAPKDEA